MATPGRRWSVPATRRRAGASTELLDALDRYIPDPKRATDRPFLMPIEGVHTIEGRGTVATGKVEQGVIAPGTKVEILGLGERAGDGRHQRRAVQPAAGARQWPVRTSGCCCGASSRTRSSVVR